MHNHDERDLRVGIAGFGAIGKEVAKKIDEGITGLSLSAISARDLPRVRQLTSSLRSDPKVVPVDELANHADIVVECMPAEAFDQVALPAIKMGLTLVVITSGALLSRPHLRELAVQHGARILLPSGALLGLDAVRAASEGNIKSVRMISKKPPQGFQGIPYLLDNNIIVEGINVPKKLFEGNVMDAVQAFPANVNVGAALSLAGIGPERTTIEIWADPELIRNTHTIEVDADSARFSMKIENIPSTENPRTGKLTALSIVSTLRRLVVAIE